MGSNNMNPQTNKDLQELESRLFLLQSKLADVKEAYNSLDIEDDKLMTFFKSIIDLNSEILSENMRITVENRALANTVKTNANASATIGDTNSVKSFGEKSSRRSGF